MQYYDQMDILVNIIKMDKLDKRRVMHIVSGIATQITSNQSCKNIYKNNNL